MSTKLWNVDMGDYISKVDYYHDSNGNAHIRFYTAGGKSSIEYGKTPKELADLKFKVATFEVHSSYH